MACDTLGSQVCLCEKAGPVVRPFVFSKVSFFPFLAFQPERSVRTLGPAGSLQNRAQPLLHPSRMSLADFSASHLFHWKQRRIRFYFIKY